MHTSRILELSIWNLAIVVYFCIILLQETIAEAVMLSLKSATFLVRESLIFENPFTWLELFFSVIRLTLKNKKIEHVFRLSGPVFPICYL